LPKKAAAYFYPGAAAPRQASLPDIGKKAAAYFSLEAAAFLLASANLSLLNGFYVSLPSKSRKRNAWIVE